MQIQTYFQYPIKITKGKGSYVWDDTGKKYLDYYGGHVVCGLGHCPNVVIEAIQKQSETLIFYSNIFQTEPNEKLANLLSETLLPEKYQVYFTNSGSEANEAAIKIARRHTGKKNIISFYNAWHGRAVATSSITGFAKQHTFKPDLLEYTRFADFGDIESVKNLYDDDTACVILEPIQSIGGVNVADTSFYTKLARFCQEKNILLIIDEVQTGLGRTGEDFWYSQTLKITPDIITNAKAIASGLPLAAALIHESIAKNIQRGDHATTFGGCPMATAAGYATVKELLNVFPKVKKISDYLQQKLSEIKGVEEVRGQGFLLGIKLKDVPENFLTKCFEVGLIIGSSSQKDIFRIMPPMNTNEEEIFECIQKLAKII